MISIHNRFINGLNGYHSTKKGIDMRKGCHDSSPDICAMEIIWRLFFQLVEIKRLEGIYSYVKFDVFGPGASEREIERKYKKFLYH